MNELYCIFGPNGNDYFRNIEFILETLGIEKPAKRDGKVFEEDISDLKEKLEVLKRKSINKEVDELKKEINEICEKITGKKKREDVNDAVNRILGDPVTKEMAKKVADQISEQNNDASAGKVYEDHDNKNLHNIPEADFANNIFNGISEMNELKQKEKKSVCEIVSDNMEESKPVSRNSLLLKSDNMKSLERVIDTINRKDKQYFKDPIQVLSIDDLLTQVKIKVIRAKLTLDDEKRKDEILDGAVYLILTLEKMLMEPVGEHTGVENYK